MSDVEPTAAPRLVPYLPVPRPVSPPPAFVPVASAPAALDIADTADVVDGADVFDGGDLVRAPVPESAPPTRLLPMRWLELALAGTQVILAVGIALVAIELFAVWRQSSGVRIDQISSDVLERVEMLLSWCTVAALAASVAMVGWTVVAAINGRRISLFAPHWLPIAIAWAIGPALLVWGAAEEGGARVLLVVLGWLVAGAATWVALLALRRTAQTVIHDGRHITHWLVAMLVAGAASSWMSVILNLDAEVGADTDGLPTTLLRDAAIATTLDALLQLGLALVSFRAARHLREGFAGQPRINRSQHHFEAPVRGVELGPMGAPRVAVTLGTTAAIVSGSLVLAMIDDGEIRGRVMSADQLRSLQFVVAVAWGLLWWAVAWWTARVARGAARLAGTSPVAAAASCIVWWLGAPVALALITVDSGPVPKIAVLVAAVLALAGHAHLAGLAGCSNMRYVAWGATIFWMTTVGGLILDADAEDLPVTAAQAGSGGVSGRTSIILLSGVVLLVLLVRVNRSLERIEQALRARKDQRAPDVPASFDPVAFFTMTP